VNRFERVADQAQGHLQHRLYMVTGEHGAAPGRGGVPLLFVDEHNHCRSQMAEAIWNALDQPKFCFSSGRARSLAGDTKPSRFLDRARQSTCRGRRRKSIPAGAASGATTRSSWRSRPGGAQGCFPPPADQDRMPRLERPDPSTVKGKPGAGARRVRADYQFLKAHITDLVQAILGDEVARRRDQP
jgi:hypothetical protein